MPDAPLDIIAASYKTIADTQQTLAQTQQVLAQTQLRLEATHRGLAWLQGVALGLLALSLLGTGWLVWQHRAQGAEHAALLEALRAESQTMSAQTQALMELVRRGH